jgi:HSP20 family protein
MADIIRWDPFRASRRMHEALDRFMDRAFLDTPLFGDLFDGTLPVDVYQTEDEVVVKASVPGIKPEDIDISVTGDTLSIRGEVQQEEEEQKGQYHLRERVYRSFARSLTLPSSVDPDKAQAEFKDGVLKLTLPKLEEAKTKRITVKSAK